MYFCLFICPASQGSQARGSRNGFRLHTIVVGNAGPTRGRATTTPPIRLAGPACPAPSTKARRARWTGKLFSLFICLRNAGLPSVATNIPAMTKARVFATRSTGDERGEIGAPIPRRRGCGREQRPSDRGRRRAAVATDDEKPADGGWYCSTLTDDHSRSGHRWSVWDIQVPKCVLRCAIPTTALPSLRAHLLLCR